MASAKDSWVWKLRTSPEHRLVMIALRDLSDDAGKATPTLPALTSMTGLTEEQVKQAIRAARDAGIIEVSLSPKFVRVPVDQKLDEIRSLYEFYPRHEAWGAAKKAIKRALVSTPYPILLEAVRAFAEAKAGQPKEFIPLPASWFNGERWLDDRDGWARPPEPEPEWKEKKRSELEAQLAVAEKALRRSRLMAAGRLGWEDGRSNRDEHREVDRIKAELARFA